MQIFAPLNSEAQPGLQHVEIASSFQLPCLQIIGLPSPEVSEAKERIRAAIESCGLEIPRRRVVLNLSPASIRKRGTGIDLAMALAVLSLSAPPHEGKLVAAWGELGLDGSVKPSGQITRSIYAAWQAGVSQIFLSTEEYESAATVIEWIGLAGFFSTPAPRLIPVSSLHDAWEYLQDEILPLENRSTSKEQISLEPSDDYAGHLLTLPPSLERPLCVAALGGHHLLLLGPKGTGKSHALEWLIALQPKSSYRVRIKHRLLLELTQTRSHQNLSTPSRPLRRVSSSVRAPALIGSFGSGHIQPGEFSLAHGGLLIADEFPEWSRDSREALREPLERGVITLTRSKCSVEFPARFSFAGNGNLCPCGGWPPEFPVPLEVQQQSRKLPKCVCTRSQRNHYAKKMSGPILDRLDLALLVGSSAVPARTERGAVRLEKLKIRTEEARRLALELWGEVPAMLSAAKAETLIEERPHWRSALDSLQLSSLRARHKIVRVALSLSVWDQVREPQAAHFMEASCYRPERFGLSD